MSNNLSYFKHIYIDNKADKTLVLLHGTGGDEHDFLFLDQQLSKNYNLLGLRGNVDEQGMNRFFRRLSFGNFDQDNIKEETAKLKEFIEAWQKEHVEELTFLGYSNGANMLLATLFYYPEMINKVALLHSMLPFQISPNTINLSKHTILMTYGAQDPMATIEESNKVITTLKSMRAQLTVKEYPSGHGIRDQEIEDIIAFLL
ncbi:alpha/beta hydrolase [soil metagenome]